MPWKERTTVSLRTEFVQQAHREEANITQLCRQFGISRKTAYKWLQRYRQEGEAGLQDRSRRPHSSPRRSPPHVEAAVLEVRECHPAWGGRKIKAYLCQQGQTEHLPSASTMTAILRRHDRIDPQESIKHRAWQRFEMSVPNQLWQMDFKGYLRLAQGGKCHPLTVLDDHSRYLVGLSACGDQTYQTVQQQLECIFRCCGLPERMLMDNGAPWGDDADTPHTVLTVWLMRLGIQVSHGRPYHPQTQGKEERVHRTLQEELLRYHRFNDLCECQRHFDRWRVMYNHERPHEALQMQVPASRYERSIRPFPEVLPPIEYDSGDIVRRVDAAGKISFRNRRFRVGKALRHQLVALRCTEQDGEYAVFFCWQRVAHISLRDV